MGVLLNGLGLIQVMSREETPPHLCCSANRDVRYVASLRDMFQPGVLGGMLKPKNITAVDCNGLPLDFDLILGSRFCVKLMERIGQVDARKLATCILDHIGFRICLKAFDSGSLAISIMRMGV